MAHTKVRETPKTCEQCARTYFVATRIQLRNQKFCSTTCMASWQTGREWKRTESGPQARKCECCGIDFIGRTPRAKVCSPRCNSLRGLRKELAENNGLEDHVKRLLKMTGYDRSQLSLEFILTMYERQIGLCALTGLKLTWKTLTGRVQTNLSIDRISPLCGYTPDNVQLVCRMANVMKGELSQSDFVAVCRRVIVKADGQ